MNCHSNENEGEYALPTTVDGEASPIGVIAICADQNCELPPDFFERHSILKRRKFGNINSLINSRTEKEMQPKTVKLFYR